MSEQVQKLFDSIAPNYDLLNSVLSLKIDQRWRSQAVRKLKEARFKNVLDLCAGTLALTSALLKTNPFCHVTAVDFSKPMLENGREHLPYGFLSKVDLVVADAMKMNFRKESFDAVMCAYGMRNVDDNELALKSVFSILKPGGRLVILEFFKPEGMLSKIFNVTYAEFVIPVLGKLVSKHPNAYSYLRDSVRNFYTPSAYRELLRTVGFKDVKIISQTGGVSHLVVAEKS